jgi:putative flavoprotein involved in K+ transport
VPEVAFDVRWPDGSAQRCISPSRVIGAALVAGGRYPVAEFTRRACGALERGSARVRDLHGFGCAAAVQQAADLRAVAAAYDPGALVTVEGLRRARPERRFPAPPRIDGHHDVVVIGGGQAGLAVSWHLERDGIDHVVLERDRIARAWRDERWDAFCLVTPNWQCRLPGHPYAGPDPDGFMVKDEIVAYVEGFADSFAPPVLEGVAVTEVARGDGDGFRVATSHGELTCAHVVLAVGAYHRPAIPRVGERLPARVCQLHSSGYRNASSLPDGAVLVVGSGQSGAQIAEDLHLAGRDVHLAVGSAPRVARRYRGRDCVAWLHDIGHYRMPIERHPEGPAARREANHYVTGRGGGRDIDLRTFAREGLRLHGRLLGCAEGRMAFAGDLAANLDAADATAERIKDTIDRHIEAAGIDAPAERRYVATWQPPDDGARPLDLEAAGVRTVIWATGFAADWSWVRLPAFDGTGYPEHVRGITTLPGLSVLGLPWLHTWGSGRFAGIAEDAGHVAGHIAARLRAAPAARSAA